MDLVSNRICVTGGAGFLGSFLVESLRKRGCTGIFVPRRRDFDLTTEAGVSRLFAVARPQVLFHLAAVVGGIGANRVNPGRYFYENAIMGMLLIEAARRHGTEKTIVVGTTCAYPKFTPVPFHEADLWNGYPEETNAPYGLAKRSLLVQCQAYRQQYGTNAIFLLPANLYGPRDNFDPESSHVIPALIRKCVEAQAAGREEIEVWGDGSPTREFIYAADAAEGLLLAAERYDGPDPVNLGSGNEISIADLISRIARICGFKGTIRWNPSQPNGQPRRCLNVENAERLFGFRATTGLEQGLRDTVAWYRGVLGQG